MKDTKELKPGSKVAYIFDGTDNEGKAQKMERLGVVVEVFNETMVSVKFDSTKTVEHANAQALELR